MANCFIIPFSKEELATEIWKDIPNYEGIYQVSNLGRVFSFSRPVNCTNYKKRIIKSRIIKSYIDKDNREYIILYKELKQKRFTIYSLVLSAFVSPRPNGMECCHNDGNTLNNRLDNLRWDTHKNNEKDKIKHNTVIQGERNGSAKLTKKQILEIRELYKQKVHSCHVISKLYNVSAATIHLIVSQKTWKHL